MIWKRAFSERWCLDSNVEHFLRLLKSRRLKVSYFFSKVFQKMLIWKKRLPERWCLDSSVVHVCFFLPIVSLLILNSIASDLGGILRNQNIF